MNPKFVPQNSSLIKLYVISEAVAFKTPFQNPPTRLKLHAQVYTEGSFSVK